MSKLTAVFATLFLSIWSGVLLVLTIIYAIVGASGRDEFAKVAQITGGCVLVMVMALIILRLRIRAQKAARVQEAKADVLAVNVIGYMRVGSMTPVKLTVSFRSSQGQVEARRSELISPLKPLKPGDSVRVKYDPNRPENWTLADSQ